MLISACKTYTSPKRCAHTKIPQWVCQTASAWLEWVKLMKSVMGYQRGELDICGGEPHLFMGRHTWSTHTHTHTHLSLPDQRIAGGVQMLPQCQNNRWIGIFFLWCLPSPCVLFKASNMRWQNFLPERKTDWGSYLFSVKCSCLSGQILPISTASGYNTMVMEPTFWML